MWDWNLQTFTRRPERYYCRHLVLYAIEVVQCTERSISKFESRLEDVIGGLLVLEIWRPPDGPLVTSLRE